MVLIAVTIKICVLTCHLWSSR